jgi:hypothetical protein
MHEEGCPWDALEACMAGARSGQLDIVRYVHEQGCSLDAKVLLLVAASKCYAIFVSWDAPGTLLRATMLRFIHSSKHFATCMRKDVPGTQ